SWLQVALATRSKLPTLDLEQPFDIDELLRKAQDYMTKTIGSSVKMAELIKSAQPLAQSFSPLHVEILIDQAAELLDRALRAREKISSLRVSSYQYLMDIWEFIRLDEIH